MFVCSNVCFDPRTVYSLLFYSCLKVILEILENLSKPDVNALLHEFGFQVRVTLSCTSYFLKRKFLALNQFLFSFIVSQVCKGVRLFLRKISIVHIMQLLYELCLDPLTCGPTMDLLSNKKYHFFVKV